MRKVKKIGLIGLALLIGLYICTCIVCRFSYSHILNSFISKENVIYNNFEDDKSMTLNNFVVYLTDDTVVFLKIQNISIAPFGVAKIPKIEYKYIYNTVSPKESVFINGRQKYCIADNIKNGVFIAKEYKLIGQEIALPSYETYYFGFSENSEIDGISDYELKYTVENGIVFLFNGVKNTDFRSDSFNVVYY